LDGREKEKRVRHLRAGFAVLLALLPSWLKIPIYRFLFRYEIGKGVRIGFSPFLGVRRCRIGDHTRIGSFNLFTQVQDLEIGEHVRVGFLNVFRGGERITVGSFATILRQNVFNAIVEPDTVNPVESVLELGPGVFVAAGHWLDFTDGIRVGGHSIIGGRNSSFWTHNRQRTRPIVIGCHAYLGSEVRLAPGVELPAFCIVALGSVLSGRLAQPRVLIGGNPARVVRELGEEDLFLVTRKTRNDIPDSVARALLPADLRALVEKQTPAPPVATGGLETTERRS
jgi:acetyltransferase-like isoleucine patch superfamily enzyme